MTAKPQERSRRIGRDFETRIERLLKGSIHAGEDGDVNLPGTNYRVECKATVGLSNVKLKEWLDQIQGYEQMPSNKETEFLLAFSGNKPYQNARVWIAMDHREFLRLLALERRYQMIEKLIEREDIKGNLEKLTSLMFDMSASIVDAMKEDG